MELKCYLMDSLLNTIWPKGLSRIAVLTKTVRTTPKISMITCIVVELWAGSIFRYFKTNGSIAPRQILLNTISARAIVIATVSASGVRKIKALMNPANDKIALNEIAIFTSLLRNCRCVRSLSVPSAIPRITTNRL